MLIDLIKNRYSLRNFSSKMPSFEDIRDILEAARLAPSFLNLQPWHFIVVKDEKHLRQLLNSGEYKKVVSDPLVEQLITKSTLEKGMKFYPLQHVAVSSKIHWNNPVRFLSDSFAKFNREILK